MANANGRQRAAGGIVLGSEEDRRLYTRVFREACRNQLMLLDEALAGREENCRFRLNAEDYRHARKAIASLWAVVRSAELRPVSTGERDAEFQRFMVSALGLVTDTGK